VCIVVESPDHGRALLRLLTGWKLLCANPTVGKPQKDNALNQSILTVMCAHQLQHLDVDVVLHASGEAPLPASWFPPRPAAGRTPLLIEVLDDADPAAQEATRQRLHAYARAGLGVECHLPAHHSAGEMRTGCDRLHSV
jgi:hypothetical protein